VEFFIRHRTIVAFCAFTLFCIISLSTQSSTFTFSIEGLGSALTTPFQRVYHGFQGGLSRMWKGYTELNEVKEELQKTRKKLQLYEALTEEISEIKNENRKLRNLLGRKEKIEYQSIPATVISKDPDNWFRTLIIDRGSDNGIEVNMPVLAFQNGNKAIVGKIVEARGSISRIIPIISIDIRIGIKFQESRYPGLLRGYSSNSNLSVVDYVSRNAEVKFGSIVITSGQGGVFPPGLLVGKVLKSEILESSAYQKIIVQPAVDYNLLEEVFVVLKVPDKDLVELFEEKK
jgi:rod shape-determining protein MreC